MRAQDQVVQMMLAAILGLAAGLAAAIAFIAYCAARSSQSAETAARLLQLRRNSR